MKRTVSVHWADGIVCITREAVFLIKTVPVRAVPHNITLFVEFEITIAPESMCGNACSRKLSCVYYFTFF